MRITVKENKDYKGIHINFKRKQITLNPDNWDITIEKDYGLVHIHPKT